jgi:hypothetical protein
MRVPLQGLLTSGLILAGVLGMCRQVAHGQGKTPTAVTPADYLEWRSKLKNWGRWGPNDERGTSNLITAAKILQATKLVKEGLVISLAHPEPQHSEVDVPESGVFHRVTNAISETNTTDTYQVSYHGQAITHMDTFCHFFF